MKLCAALLLALAPLLAAAQSFDFAAPVSADDPRLAEALRDLAERILPVYEEPDQDRYLANLSVLQLAAGDAKPAAESRERLRSRRRNAGQSAGRDLLIDFYAQARAAEAAGQGSFAAAFMRAFREALPRLSDREAYAVTADLDDERDASRQALQQWLDRLRGQPRVEQDPAIELLRASVYFELYRKAGAELAALAAEDDARRYVVEELIVPGSAGIHARLVRPKRADRIATLLEFTNEAAPDDARACAARGYAGVVAYVRGKDPAAARPGRERVVPFEHDGEDARAVIRWIAKQAWSDGRVGMYGDRYAGFAAWAAAKHPPAALQAIATADPMAPGIDFPASGRIFRNQAYRWAERHTRKTLEAAAGERDWQALDLAWYRSGKSYRALDVLAGDPNRVFRRWLGHPSYDRYWQKLIPFGREFSKIDFPVLTVSGYYADAQPAALYYFGEHLHARAKAEHSLLLGPYADATIAGVPPPTLRGYTLDAAALTDLRALRWQWFDHVFKGAAKPALLADRVNYEVMGANHWRHAASLQAMANATQRFYLDGRHAGGSAKLAGTKPPRGAHVDLGVNLADRNDAELPGPFQIQARKLDLSHAVSFVSEPLAQPLELSGLLSGRLDFRVNKLDFDLKLALYELTGAGDYILLTAPYELRLSYAADRTQRTLLAVNRRQQLQFHSECVMSKQLSAGSRLVLLLGVVKRPDRELNYGSGKDVSEESVEDAGAPLKLRWYGGSYLELPLRR